MNYNWPIIGDKIFGILRGRGFHLQMFDKSGQKTMDPHEATRFLAQIPSSDPSLESYDVLISLHNADASSHMDIKTPNISNNEDFEKIVALKNSLQTNIGDREGLSVNWYKFDHDIDAKDDAVNNIKESKDISKPFGTTKSSYQMIGDSKLIIRHTDPIDEQKKGSRWRQIKSIFIETKIGERFAYPYAHIAGARAMARHLANEGAVMDDIGRAITEMSEDYIELKKAIRLLRGHDPEMADKARQALHGINKDVKRLGGNRGYARGIDLIKEGAKPLDEAMIAALTSRMAETCGCGADQLDANKALATAAQFIVALENETTDEAVSKQLFRKRDIGLIADIGDGYFLGADVHDDGEVKKVTYNVYHLEDQSGSTDEMAHAYRYVDWLQVSPYRPSREDVMAAAEKVKMDDMSSDDVSEDAEILRLEQLAGII